MNFRLGPWTILAICVLLLACAGKKPAEQTTGGPQPQSAAQPETQPPPQPTREAAEKPEKKTESGSISIAVWDLDDLTTQEMSQPELGELLASKVVETIQKKGGYSVIEKTRLAAARKNLRVGKSSVSDPTIRLQLGKNLGAQQMVFGGYQVLEGKMKLELHLLDVETGRIIKSSEEAAPASSISGWLDAAQRAAAALL